MKCLSINIYTHIHNREIDILPAIKIIYSKSDYSVLFSFIIFRLYFHCYIKNE